MRKHILVALLFQAPSAAQQTSHRQIISKEECSRMNSLFAVVLLLLLATTTTMVAEKRENKSEHNQVDISIRAIPSSPGLTLHSDPPKRRYDIRHIRSREAVNARSVRNRTRITLSIRFGPYPQFTDCYPGRCQFARLCRHGHSIIVRSGTCSCCPPPLPLSRNKNIHNWPCPDSIL